MTDFLVTFETSSDLESSFTIVRVDKNTEEDLIEKIKAVFLNRNGLYKNYHITCIQEVYPNGTLSQDLQEV